MSTNRLCIQLNKVVMLIYSNLGRRWKFALWNSLPLKKQQFPAHRKSECHKQRLGSIFSRWFTSFILAATVWRWTFQTCDPRYLSAARNRTGEMGRLRTLFVRLIATMADMHCQYAGYFQMIVCTVLWNVTNWEREKGNTFGEEAGAKSL